MVERFEADVRTAFVAQELLRAGPASEPAAAARCGRTLMDAGLVDEAEALYSAMEQGFPSHPAGWVGLAQAAMRHKNWHEALTRWDHVLTAFSGISNGFWLSGRAVVLFELGRRQEAVAIHAELVRDFPDDPAGYAGMAQLALRQRSWPEALARCDELLARFPDHAAADGWRTMRASPLLELGRAAEAEGFLRRIVERAPGSENALLTLLRVCVHSGRPDVAWSALNASPLRGIETPALMERRLDLLIRLNRRDEARSIVEERLSRAERPDLLAGLLNFVPLLYERCERARIWRQLSERVHAARKGSAPHHRVSLDVMEARLQLALRNRDGVVTAVRHLMPYPYLGEEGEALRRVSAALADPGYPDYQKLMIFGIGLSRTGTTTLAAALSLLGFHTLHWRNPLTCEVISDDDFLIFDAFTDTPVSTRFETLYLRFPNSKFIFTTRKFEDWQTSISGLWRRQLGMSGFDEIRAELKAPRYGTEYADINRTLYFDYAGYREAFDAHEQRVRQFFRDKPADRFLEFDIFGGDGWPKLCAFVGREAPAMPFPWENRQPDGRDSPTS